MRYRGLLFLLLSLFLFNSCGDGLTSLPELSGKLVEALKMQDFVSVIKLIPNKDDIKLAAKLYEGGSYTKAEWEQLAESKQEALLLQTDIDYKKILKDLQDKGFDIRHAALKDSKYQNTKTSDNYDVSSVELVLKSGEQQCTLLYHAITIKDRWFLDKDMVVKSISN